MSVPAAVLVVIMNAASTQAIPVAAFESMAACEAMRPRVTALYTEEWAAATMSCIAVTYAPLTSPRPKPRPQQEEKP